MKVWGVSEAQLYAIADELSVKLYELREDGRALRFTLRPTGERRDGDYRYQRTSASGFNPGRRVHAVCWHGHRDFMLAVFRVNPEARIKTMWADYRGVEDFNEKYPATAHHNVGSMMYPMRADQVCNCHKGEWLVDLSPSPSMSSYQMKQDMLRACPFFIIDPSHYRVDGTCKCNDPDEQDRMIREWEYTREDFERVGV